MKYEQQLKARMIPSWHLYYMAYSQLKQLLKQKSDHWLIQDEEEFENILGSELSKVCRFLRHQLDRISEQTHQLEKQCQQLRQRQRIFATKTTPSENSDGVVDNGYATQVTELVFELHDTAQFLHSNKTAFDKMVKKHDRYTSFTIQHRYNHSMTTSSLDTYTQQLDSLMIRLCYLYDLCRHPQQQSETSHDRSQQHEQQQNLHCTTFWIHPDNINEVKAICLFHLSIYPYGTKQSTTTTTHPQERNNSITSIYLDNGNFDLYKKQVEVCNDYNTTLLGKDAANVDDWNSNRMVRCRWYGHDSPTMHLERQQSQGIGNQQRCIIDGVTESAYLKNTHHGNGTVSVNTSLSRHLDNTYHQIQQSIRQQHLEPKCRTTCQRLTFQQPQQQQHGETTTLLRLHIDTNIKLSKISKTNNSNNKHQDGSGGRSETKTHAFPYGLLTLHHHGTAWSTNHWLAQLLSSHLVYPVPRFSTFVHAISVFYGDQLALSFLSPWWILSVPKDIRKPPCNPIGLSRTTTTHARPLINGHRQASFEQQLAATSQLQHQHIAIPLSTQPTTVFDVKKDPEQEYCWWRLRRRRQHQHDHHHHDHQRLNSHDSSLLTEEEDNDDGYPAATTTTTITNLSSTTIISKGKKKATTNNKGKKEVTTALEDSMKNNRLTEPKTYFANERTFISWLQFCAVLLTVALSLFNHGDWISRWMGGLFLGMTCLLTFYALGRFQYRSWQLRTRRYVLRYDDVFGPTVLCFFLVIAMMINIYLRLPLFEF